MATGKDTVDENEGEITLPENFCKALTCLTGKRYLDLKNQNIKYAVWPREELY